MAVGLAAGALVTAIPASAVSVIDQGTVLLANEAFAFGGQSGVNAACMEPNADTPSSQLSQVQCPSNGRRWKQLGFSTNAAVVTFQDIQSGRCLGASSIANGSALTLADCSSTTSLWSYRSSHDGHTLLEAAGTASGSSGLCATAYMKTGQPANDLLFPCTYNYATSAQNQRIFMRVARLTVFAHGFNPSPVDVTLSMDLATAFAPRTSISVTAHLSKGNGCYHEASVSIDFAPAGALYSGFDAGGWVGLSAHSASPIAFSSELTGSYTNESDARYSTSDTTASVSWGGGEMTGSLSELATQNFSEERLGYTVFPKDGNLGTCSE